MDHKPDAFFSLNNPLPERILFLHKITSTVMYLVKKYTASHNTEFPVKIWSVAVDINPLL